MINLANQLFDYIEGLTLTQGRLSGQPFQLAPWQRRFLRGMMRVDGDRALTVARGNGKSTLIAGLALAALGDTRRSLGHGRAEAIA